MKTIGIFAMTAVFLVGLCLGYLSGAPSGDVHPAYAALCKAPNPSCPPATPYRTAAVDVHHLYEAFSQPVEPEVGETWAITAYLNTASPAPCDEIIDVAYVDVSWNGSTWVTSNFQPGTYITAVGVCGNGDECGSQTTPHSWGYRIYVKVWDPVNIGGEDYNLRRVKFTTNAVDDGYVVNTSTCTLGLAVSPTSQVFTAYDDGGWPCGFDCTASDATVDITSER
jgi:hypothetical protein